MGVKQTVEEDSSDLFLNPRQYFAEMVEAGLSRKQLRPPSMAQDYLVNLLEHYLDARNLFDEEVTESGQRKNATLAEMYLRGLDPSVPDRLEVLKRLADRTLYISGFFGDSLSRSLVDIDYYAGLGGAAYRNLAGSARQNQVGSVYMLFADRFLDFVDVLTYISHHSCVKSDEGILRLYDRYLKTGSEMVREQLVQAGVVPLTKDQLKSSRQD
ncbi:MAG: hypothetical protein C5B49_09560 [Bdellovibrio sp.]|nr:MAG: hypothetical protein C5B49_09560 [Bdellovibrio sp.]